jgi:hypothetical protein
MKERKGELRENENKVIGKTHVDRTEGCSRPSARSDQALYCIVIKGREPVTGDIL